MSTRQFQITQHVPAVTLRDVILPSGVIPANTPVVVDKMTVDAREVKLKGFNGLIPFSSLGLENVHERFIRERCLRA
ncbi:MAG: hypothetical protein AAB758_00395 [Patescibacteria group bacterium]